MTLKVVAAEKGIGMTKAEALKFLSETMTMLRLGTIDSDGDPNIHPAWFYYGRGSGKLYLFTWKGSKKVENVRRRGRVYFDADDDRPPYRGVRGKASARVLPPGPRSVTLTRKVVGKYLPLTDRIARSYVAEVQRGDSLVVELTPLYLSTWDYAKAS